MAVFRIEKTRDYTVMSNHHLRDMSLSLKAKGLLECRTHCSTAESFANTCVTPVLRAYVKMQRTAQCIGDCHNSRQGGA